MCQNFIHFFFFWQESRIYWWVWVRRQGSHKCRVGHLTRGPQLGTYWTPQPSRMSHFPATMFSNSPALNLVNPYFLETWIFWWPGNLNLALLGPQSQAPCFAAWYGWTSWLGHVNPGYCAQGFSKGSAHTYLEPRPGAHASHECPLARADSRPA